MYNNSKPPVRIGTGYDVHRLVPGRRLILGGVDIPYEKGLEGHSDADVLVHAVIDAIFGSLALGDLGQHFPDDDDSYKGISSIELLRRAGGLVRMEGYRIMNIDSQVVCQSPKLAPHNYRMRTNIADALMLSVSQVSVKATTEEGLGFTGSGEGIAAHAAVCVMTGDMAQFSSPTRV